MLKLFDEITITNRAYCRALGIDSTPHETPLSPDEILIANERRWLGDRGMTEAKAAVWAPINVLHGVSNHFRAVVEYARPPSLWDQQDISPYYDDCRAKHTQRAGVWVGD